MFELIKKKQWRWLLLCHLKTREFSSLPQSVAKEKPTEDTGVAAFTQKISRATWGKHGVLPKPFRKDTKNKFKKSMLFKSSKMLKMGIGSFSFFFPFKFAFLIWRGILPWHGQIILRRIQWNIFGSFYFPTFSIALLMAAVLGHYWWHLRHNPFLSISTIEWHKI